jgi:hypothetical protein
MRDHDEEDPKKPRPVRAVRKGYNAMEYVEVNPWRSTRNDIDLDRHRHV